MHILYIEDNSADADLTRRYLARHMPEVTLAFAENFANAVTHLEGCTQEQPIFDLILTDMRLPDGDGLSVINYIRSRALPLPVIVLTGTGNEELAVLALKGGADDYITKRHDYLTRLPVALETTLMRFRTAASQYNRTLNILYAEHYKIDVDLTRRHLAQYAPHIQLDVVYSAPEVLARLSAEADAPSYDLLLLDYRLPGMNGLDLLKELEYSGKLNLPVVLVTGQGDEEVATQALRFGVSNYLVKNPGYLFQLPRTLENIHAQTLLQHERAALFESEQRYRALFDHAPVVIFTQDLSGIYTSANTMAVELFGCDPVGLSDADLTKQGLHGLLAADPVVFERGAEHLREERVMTPKGERVFLSRKSPLRDRRGNVTGLMCISLEITERIRAEEAERENQRRLAQLAEHIDEVIWLYETTQDKLLYISPAYERVWGCSVESAYADVNSMTAAIVPDDRERVLSIAQATLSGHTASMEYRIQRPDGSIVWVAAQTFPIHNDQGQIYRIAGLARDITERRRSEDQHQQQARLVSVGQMAAGIAHDFNNILAIIMLYTQMLQVSVQSSVHQRHLTTIYQQATHAANLVQQILDFSRRSPIERVIMDVVPFIKELVRLWRRTLPENIRVEFEMEDLPLVISADASRLQQALMNMAINARDAMNQGGTLHLRVSAMTLLPGQTPPLASMNIGKWLCITMCDSGMGIPPDVLPHVFDPFFTTKSTGEGTGLGLAQVYGIVRQLDGFIQVESEVGVGATFTTYLPLIEQQAPPVEGDPQPLMRGKGETILLVEDETALREAIAEMLTQLGYAVLPAEDGQDALSLYAEHQSVIKLIVSDVVMPDMGGQELVQQLAEAYGDTVLLRVLLVTGYSMENLEEWHASSGIVKWLQKPFTVETLAQHVAEMLNEPQEVEQNPTLTLPGSGREP
jgi:PAS domain S-box-containing protein